MKHQWRLSRRQILAGAPVGALVATGAWAKPSDGAASAGDLVLSSGSHRIVRDTEIGGSLVVHPGARLEIVAGATLSVRGDVVAPAVRIFWGEGGVDLTHSRALAARPEWWGAAADDPRVDCAPALRACLAAHLSMQLGPGDYRIADTWTIDRSNRRIWGIGRSKDARGTRLLLARGGLGDSQGIVMRVGTEARPASINDYVSGIDLRGIEFGRAIAAAPGDDLAIGLAVRHVLDCRFEDLRANEHAIGYSLRGAVRTYLRDCRAFRSLASDSAGRDTFVGFDMDGRTPPISTGANASLYLIDCNATTGGRPRLAESVGVRMLGAMSDTVLTRFETTEVATGILIDGAPGTQGAGNRYSQVDIHIDTPVLDQCGSTGIRVAGLGATAMMEVRSPYVAVAPGGDAAIAITRSGGSIRIAGGQLIGSFSRTAIGLAIDDVSGLALDGSTLLGFARPVDARSLRNFELVCAINAEEPGAGPAIALRDCVRGYVRPRVFGAAKAFGGGVAITGSSQALSIETVGIDPSVLASGAATVTMKGRAVAPYKPGTVVTVASPQ